MTGKRIVVFALFALAALALALSARGSAEAQTYRPYYSYSLANTAPGANSNSAIGFSIAAPDFSYEDASMTILLPVDGWTANGLEAPIGAYVGTLSASVTVGLLGGPCNQVLTPSFTLKNASVDISDELVGMTWILAPAGTTPVPDADGDGLYDYEEQYPWFLNDMLDPDGSGPLLPLQPRARYAGHTAVASLNMLVQLLIFNPGQMTPLGGIYSQMTAEKGAPALIVLNNPLGGIATPGPISDFCSPKTTTATLLGLTLDNPRTVWVNDGCPSIGGLAESGSQCFNNTDDDDAVNDGCPAVGWAESGAQCDNSVDDVAINDGCAQVGARLDCDTDATPDGDCTDPGEAALCANNTSDDGADDTIVNDGCPQLGLRLDCDTDATPDGDCTDPGEADLCINAVSDDGADDLDGYVNDGCPQVGARLDCDTDATPDGDCTDPGEAALCANGVNDDPSDGPADGFVNDGCPAVGSAESGGQCANAVDDDWAVDEAGYVRQSNPAANTGVLGTGTHMAENYSQSERNADGDAVENDLDACPYTADPAWNPRVSPCVAGANPGDQDCDMLPTSCDPNDVPPGGNNPDQDADGYNNAQDNCALVQNGAAWDNQADRDVGMTNADLGPRSDAIGDACDDSDDDGNEDGAGTGTCNDGIDNGGDTTVDGADADCTASMDKVDWPPTTANPNNGAYYHGMPWAAVCVGGTDTDGDGYCDALEAMLGSPVNNGPETGAQCTNAVDDDGDGFMNDGCPFVAKYAETGAQCANAISDDTPTPDTTETPAVINDGCPTIGTPESKVIDAAVTAAAALPAPTAAQSCSDGIDNDNDGLVDGTDGGPLGCNPAGYAGDTDFDGVADGSDNCPAVWNPTQANTDFGFAATTAFPAGDALGDACDTDDDADGYTDVREYYLPTDPLDRCASLVPLSVRSDAWPLDQNLDRAITVAGDVLKYSGKIGQSVSGSPPGSWALSRLDLDGNRTITVAGDVLKYAGKIGATCT